MMVVSNISITSWAKFLNVYLSIVLLYPLICLGAVEAINSMHLLQKISMHSKPINCSKKQCFSKTRAQGGFPELMSEEPSPCIFSKTNTSYGDFFQAVLLTCSKQQFICFEWKLNRQTEKANFKNWRIFSDIFGCIVWPVAWRNIGWIKITLLSF